MSLKSWLEEFYPVKANTLVKKSDAEALEHSLKKWEGLKYVNLSKHNVKRFNQTGIAEKVADNPFQTNAWSCALCMKYEEDGECTNCPISKARKGCCCATPTNDELDNEQLSPWEAWSADSDPEPMIFWLNKAKEHTND